MSTVAQPSPSPSTLNEWADFWRYQIGLNVIPAIPKTKMPTVKWDEYQFNPIPQEIHDKWKSTNAFDGGLLVILGMVHHNKKKKGLFCYAVDCDNQAAINEILNYGTRTRTIEDIAKITLVEQHLNNRNKMHIVNYTTVQPPNKAADNARRPEINTNQIPSFEVLSSRRIMLVTPSVHKSGHPYQIIGTREPCLTDDFIHAIDDICRKYDISYLDAPRNRGSANTPISELFKEDYTVYEGNNRHLSLLRVMESLIRRNARILSLDKIKQYALDWNNRHCRPPLDEDNFERQWRDATKYIEQDERNKDNPNPINNNNNNNNNDGDKPKKLQRKSMEQNRDDLYRNLMSRFIFKTLEDSQDILWYDESKGVYQFGGEIKIKQELENIYNEELGLFEDKPRTNLLTEADRNELVARIKWNTIIGRKELEHNDDLIINMQNGLFNLETRELLSHTPDYVSIKQLPIIYDPKASWVPIIKFLNWVQNTEGVKTLMKMFGYILMVHSTKYQKAFFLVGKGDNGKSVVTNLCETFVGEDNCSSIKLHDLKNDRFMVARMYGKIINTYADLPATSLQDVGLFKALVSGDKITAQNKHGPLFEFRNRAKMIYSGNNIPLSDGEDELAYFKRWVIITFERIFKGDKQDRDLIKKLTTPENLSGLFNLALVGLDLLEREGFQDVPIQYIREEYDRKSVSFQRFVTDKCQINVGKSRYYIIQDDFSNSFLKYCQEHDLEILNEEQIEIELSTLGVFEKRKQFDGIKKKCWIGIITTEEADRRNQEILERQRQNTL